MSSSPHPPRDELAAYVRAELPEPAEEAVADHLEQCQACEETVSALEHEAGTFFGSLPRPGTPEPYVDEPQCRQVLERIRAEGPRPADTPPTEAFGGSSSPAPTMPMQLREYQILEKLGQGGMGTVYKALHTKLDKFVALKVLPAAAMQNAERVTRFESEMKAVGKVEHPNIVRAMDAGCHEGVHFLVMEYIDGMDLAGIVGRCGPLRIADACEVIRQAALGLGHADEHALVHRDIKPSNLVLNTDGQVKILDLGLALLQGEPMAGTESTDQGRAMGTADYMAPEQARDSRLVDIRADIYSLGCTLYALLAGQAPFSGPEYKNNFDKLAAHVSQPFPAIRETRPDVPQKLAAVLERMVAKDPDARYAKPSQVIDDLKSFCPGCDLAGMLTHAQKGTYPAVPASAAAAAPAQRAHAEKPPSPFGPFGRGAGGEGMGPGRPVGPVEGEVRRPMPSANAPPKPATARSHESAARPRPTPSPQSPIPKASRPTPPAQPPTLFDPYHKWLGIPPGEQPPNHYRLLGVPLFEEDRDVIQASAERQTVFLRNVALGKHSKESQRLLNEVHQAKICLLTPEEKIAYDARLRKELAPKPAPGRTAGPAHGESGRPAGRAEGDVRRPAPGAGVVPLAGPSPLGAGLPTPPKQPTARSPAAPSPEDEREAFSRLLTDLTAPPGASDQPSRPKPRSAARARTYLRRVRPYSWIAAAFTVAVVLLGVIYVTTGKGTVKIELSDPAANVELRVDGNQIDIAGLKDPLRLSVGEHALEVTSGEFQTVTDTFVIRRGGETPVRVTLVPKGKPRQSDPVVRTPPANAQPPSRWLGYEFGRHPGGAMLAEVAPHTNLAIVGQWESRGIPGVLNQARRRGVKLLLGFPSSTVQEYLDRGLALWKANRDVVMGGMVADARAPFDLAAWSSKIKQAAPEAQLWVLSGRSNEGYRIPDEVDVLVLACNRFDSPGKVQTFGEQELPEYVKRVGCRRIVLSWQCVGSTKVVGRFPVFEAGTFGALAELVQKHKLAGVYFGSYGPSGGWAGIQSRPDLVDEIKGIAKHWGIGSDAAASPSSTGDAKSPAPALLPNGEGTEASEAGRAP